MLMLCISIRSSMFPSDSEKDRTKEKEKRGWSGNIGVRNYSPDFMRIGERVFVKCICIFKLRKLFMQLVSKQTFNMFIYYKAYNVMVMVPMTVYGLRTMRLHINNSRFD